MENKVESKKSKKWLFSLLLIPVVVLGVIFGPKLFNKEVKQPEEVTEATEAAKEQEQQESGPLSELRSGLAADGEDEIAITEAIALTGEPLIVNGKKTLTGAVSLTAAGVTGDYIIVIGEGSSLVIDGLTIDGEKAARNGILVSPGADLDFKSGLIKNVKCLGINVLGEADIAGDISGTGSNWLSVDKGGKAAVKGAKFDNSKNIGITVYEGGEIDIASSLLTGSMGFIVYNEGKASIEESELSDSPMYLIANNGSMTVKKTSVKDGSLQGLVNNYPGAKLTMEDCQLEKCADFMFYNSGSADVTGTTVKGSGGYSFYNAGEGAYIHVADSSVADSGASSFYNRKDTTMELENVSVTNTGGYALLNRAGKLTADGFTTDRVKSYTVRNDVATDTDSSYGTLELRNFDLEGSNNFCVINFGGNMVLKNGTVGKSTSSGIYIRDGKANISNVKVLGIKKGGSATLPTVHIGKKGITSAVVTMNNVDIKGGPRGITNYGTTTFNSGSIHDNTNYGGFEVGAGINNFNVFIMNGGSIKNNTATKYAGGVYNVGTFRMNGGNITDNKAKTGMGGGIYNLASGKVTISGGTIEGNRSGGEYSGGGLFTTGKVVIEGDAKFIGNVSAGSGGAISIAKNNVGGSGEVTIKGGTFKDNVSTGAGGVIMNKGVLNISGGTFDGNKAGNYGGAVYCDRGVKTTITGGTFSNNDTPISGGGFFILSDASISNATITGNTAGDKGGGMYVKTPATVSITGCVIEKNSSVDIGSGIMNYQGTLIVKDTKASSEGSEAIRNSNGSLTLDGKDNITAFSTGAVNIADGFSADSDVSILMNSYSEGKQVLTGSMTAIANSYDKAFTIVDLQEPLRLLEDGTVGNSNADVTANLYDADGTLIASGSFAAMVNKSVTGQTVELIADAELSDKLVIDKDITVKDDGTARTISVTSQERGFQVAIGSKLTIKGSEAGGLTFKGSVIAGNAIVLMSDKTAGKGGTLDVSGNVTFCDFNTTNTATGNDKGGSAIFLFTLGKATLDGTKFINNTAGKAGGAIYSYGTVELNNVTFDGNKSLGGSAGAVYNNNGTLTAKNVTLTNNSSSASAGAIQIYGGTVCLENVTASGNSATNSGQDVYMTSITGGPASLIVNGGSFASGKGDGIKASFYVNSGTLGFDGKLAADLYTNVHANLAKDFAADSAVTLYLKEYKNGQVVLTGDSSAVSAAVAAGAFTLPKLTANISLAQDGKLRVSESALPEAYLYNASGVKTDEGTFADMTEKAVTGETVELKSDVTIASKLTLSKDITIRDDGEARTVTVNSSDRGIQVSVGNKLTLNGSAGGGLTFKGGEIGGSGIVLMSNKTSGLGGTLIANGNVTFRDFNSTNTASGNTEGSSAIYLFTLGCAKLNGTQFINNKSAKAGGAIYNYGTLEMEGVLFDGNTSAASGGAVYNNAGTVKAKDTVFKNNVSGASSGMLHSLGGNITLENVTASGNTAANTGKDVYITNSSTSNAVVVINGGSFTSGTGADTLSSIYANSGTFTLDGKLTADFYTKIPMALGSGFAADSAVKLYLSAYQDGQTVLTGDADVIKAAVEGGAFTLPSAGTGCTLETDGKLKVTEAPPTPPTPPETDEAVLYGPDGQKKSSGSFTEMVAAASAGDAVELTSDVEISSKLTIGKNISIRDDGTARTVTIKSSDRGIQVSAAYTLTLIGTETGGLNFVGGSLTGAGIQLETVGDNGAALFTEGKITFSGFTSTNGITPNTNGGSVIMVTSKSSANLNGTTFKNNSATKTGGVIYNGGSLSIKNCTFTGNSSKSAGGVLFTNGTLTVESSTFTGNSATGYGGVMQIQGKSVTLKNVTMSGNTATNLGFDLYVAGAAATTLVVDGGSFTSGKGGITKTDSCSIAVGYNAGTTVKLANKVKGQLYLLSTMTCKLDDSFSADSDVLIALAAAQWTAGRTVLTGTASVISGAVNAGAFTTSNTGYSIGTDGTLKAK